MKLFLDFVLLSDRFIFWVIGQTMNVLHKTHFSVISNIVTSLLKPDSRFIRLWKWEWASYYSFYDIIDKIQRETKENF